MTSASLPGPQSQATVIENSPEALTPSATTNQVIGLFYAQRQRSAPRVFEHPLGRFAGQNLHLVAKA